MIGGAVRRLVRAGVRRAGFDLVRHDPARDLAACRSSLLARYGIDLVLDVGANDGPFAAALRRGGYRGRILSVEPQRDAFERLAARAALDPLWDVRRLGVGAAESVGRLHVAGNSSSSSFLPMTALHVAAAPGSAYVAEEEVAVSTLDAIAAAAAGDARGIYLKIDTQGYEAEVLRGAPRVLAATRVVDLELSFAPLYEGAPLAHDVLALLSEAGFAPVALEPVLVDPVTRCILQADVVAVRPDGAARGGR